MTTCRFRDPKTNQILIGKLNGQGVCEYDPESTEAALVGYWSPKDKKGYLEKKASAPEILHLSPKELKGMHCGYEHFCSPTKDDFEQAKMEFYNRVTKHFKSSTCSIPLDSIDLSCFEKKTKNKAAPHDRKHFEDPNHVLSMLKKNLKIVIPFLPKMSKVLSMRNNVYFSHMLWFIGIFGDKDTGIANVRQQFFQNYLSISERTERRLREFFIKNRIFNCAYDRKSHYLQISVNWDGLDEFLRNFDDNLAVFPEEFRNNTLEETQDETSEEVPEEEIEKALEQALENMIQEPVKEPEEPSIDPVTITLTKSEKEVFKSFIGKLDQDASALSHVQIQTAISDLGCSNLFNPAFIAGEGRYIGCDQKHVLLPFFETGTYDTRMMLQSLVREASHLIPVPRPFENVPEFYYQGETHEMNPFWGARERMTFNFTKRIAHLVGLSSYRKIIGEISIVEWNSISGAHSRTGRPLTQFVIATRNGVTAAIIGMFLSWTMAKFDDNSFEFRIVPLENGVILSNETRPW